MRPQPDSVPAGTRHKVFRVLRRTLLKSFSDGIFGMAAQGAFWQALSLPPLLLGLLGSIGYFGSWFGAETVQEVEDKALAFCQTVFSPSVVEQIIGPTVRDILNEGRGDVVSIGFLISLWAGSSAMASFVDAITTAYRQREIRNVIWQRIFGLLLYLVALVIGVFTLPLLALGPGLLSRLVPGPIRNSVAELVDWLYYPGIGLLLVLALATLYKVALPRKLPWHRGLPGAMLAMIVFLLTSSGLRLYIGWVTSTGFTYGALATPIALLLFTFFIGFAIVIGAQLNNAIEEMWPAHMTRRERRRWRRLEMERAAERLRAERTAGRKPNGGGRAPKANRPATPAADDEAGSASPEQSSTGRSADSRSGTQPALTTAQPGISRS
ncbi:MAG TPA: YihY/virulence factor BrkB family protein [Pseudonocardiaceae bacterium]|nr:YihY/virulence factor BrkB family protein [Pseudonocardiaceae bacterium]